MYTSIEGVAQSGLFDDLQTYIVLIGQAILATFIMADHWQHG